LLVVLGCAVVMGVDPVTWKDCSKPDAHSVLKSLDINPQPPVLGQTLTITGKGVLDEEVTSGDYTLIMKYQGIQILTHTHSVCGDDTINLPLGLGTITVHGLNCPQAAGDIVLYQTADLPKNTPGGQYEIDFSAVDDKKEQLTCVNLYFKV